MDKSPTWEADSHSASQEIPRLLWNPKVHYRVHKSQQLVPVLCEMHPVHNFSPYVLQIYSNIILPFTPSSSQVSFLLDVTFIIPFLQPFSLILKSFQSVILPWHYTYH
jgi:hypothetical protein